jgi:regulator of protease activity HflC (stomatin/prohibitin superfamily)
MKISPFAIVAAAIVIIVLIFGARFMKQVPAGHVAVATQFGQVVDKAYEPGLHFVNPLFEWVLYDVRDQTLKEDASIPTQDQLITQADISVQFRVDSKMAPEILKNTGDYDKLIAVHMIPRLRSLAREQGRSVKRAEEFFTDTTQDMIQKRMEDDLKSFLAPKGIIVDSVLLRDFELPAAIQEAIQVRKQREQQAEQQKVELDRYKTEQQQTVAKAQAEREAAAQEAEQRKLLADAQAYEIEKINNAIANNPAYVQIKALEALEAISASPSSKIYFINGDSPTPLPLMHMGDAVTPVVVPAPAP